jgi:hypothetical protein
MAGSTSVTAHRRTCRCSTCEAARDAAWASDKASVPPMPAKRAATKTAPVADVVIELHLGNDDFASPRNAPPPAIDPGTYCSLCGMVRTHWLGCDGTAARVAC